MSKFISCIESGNDSAAFNLEMDLLLESIDESIVMEGMVDTIKEKMKHAWEVVSKAIKAFIKFMKELAIRLKNLAINKVIHVQDVYFRYWDGEFEKFTGEYVKLCENMTKATTGTVLNTEKITECEESLVKFKEEFDAREPNVTADVHSRKIMMCIGQIIRVAAQLDNDMVKISETHIKISEDREALGVKQIGLNAERACLHITKKLINVLNGDFHRLMTQVSTQ